MRYFWAILLLFVGFFLIVSALLSMGAVAGGIFITNVADAVGQIGLLDAEKAYSLRQSIPEQISLTALYATELTFGTLLVAIGLKKALSD